MKVSLLLLLFGFVACFGQKPISTVSFIAIFDIKEATKDGYYLNGYVVTVDYEQAKKINGKKIKVTGELTIVKGLSNQPDEYDNEGKKIFKQGRELDTKHITNPSIEVLEWIIALSAI